MEQPGMQTDLIAHDISEIQQIQMEGYELVVKKARNALFWAGGLLFVAEMVAMFSRQQRFDIYVFSIAVLEAGIFIALALYTRKKPYTAIVLGLCAFILVILASVVIAGLETGAEGVFKALFSGVIIKTLILVALIRPLKDAKQLQELKEENRL